MRFRKRQVDPLKKYGVLEIKNETEPSDTERQIQGKGRKIYGKGRQGRKDYSII